MLIRLTRNKQTDVRMSLNFKIMLKQLNAHLHLPSPCSRQGEVCHSIINSYVVPCIFLKMNSQVEQERKLAHR